MKITKILELLHETVGQSYLYHSTQIGSGAQMMEQGKITAQVAWSDKNDIRTRQYICLTRDSQLHFTLNASGHAHALMIKIKRDILKQTHKLFPFSYFGTHHNDPDRRESKFYNGGLYMPDQWYKHKENIREKGPDNHMLNRMESEEFTNKDIPINSKYVAELQIYVTRTFDPTDDWDCEWCNNIMKIIRKAEELHINWTLYNSENRRRIMDDYIQVIKKCAENFEST